MDLIPNVDEITSPSGGDTCICDPGAQEPTKC